MPESSPGIHLIHTGNPQVHVLKVPGQITTADNAHQGEPLKGSTLNSSQMRSPDKTSLSGRTAIIRD